MIGRFIISAVSPVRRELSTETSFSVASGEMSNEERDVLRSHRRVRQNHHEDEVAAVEAHCLKARDRHARAFRTDRKRGIVRHRGRDAHTRGKYLAELVPACAKRTFKPLYLRGGEVVAIDERVDVKSVARLGGDAPRRSVGLLEIPESLKLRHFVAYGSRRVAYLLILCQVLASDRLAVLYMRVHYCFKYKLFPLA